MATFPARKDCYVRAVESILPQVDRLCICFNEYDEIPGNCPKSDKIVAICANGKNGIPDLGCMNKMYWIEDYAGYYAIVDDDIIYEPDYISFMKKGLKHYDNRVVVAIQARILDKNAETLKIYLKD